MKCVVTNMVPCHTRPVFGSEKIYNLLTVYRDGIEYIMKRYNWYHFIWCYTAIYITDCLIMYIFYSIIKANSGKYLIQFFNTFEKDFNSNSNSDSNTNSDTNSKNKQTAIIDFIIEMAQSNIGQHKTMDDCQWGLDVATNIMSLRDDITYNLIEVNV